MSNSKQPRFWKLTKLSEGRIGLTIEIHPRTVDEHRLLIPSDFWAEKGQVVGRRASIVWSDDPHQRKMGVDIVVSGGEAFFGRGWSRFSTKNGLKCWDVIRMLWWEGSLFYVKKFSWENLSSTPADVEPKELVNLDSDEVEEEEAPEVELRKGTGGKKIKKVKLKKGFDFGREYPKYICEERELSFPLRDAVVLCGEPRKKEWVIVHLETNKRWDVTILVYHDHYPRAVITHGWRDIRAHFKLKRGDIISMKILDKSANPPTMRIHVQKPSLR